MTTLNLTKSRIFLPELKKILPKLFELNPADIDLKKTIKEINFYINYPFEVHDNIIKSLLQKLHSIVVSYGSEAKELAITLSYLVEEINFMADSERLMNKHASIKIKIDIFNRSV